MRQKKAKIIDKKELNQLKLDKIKKTKGEILLNSKIGKSLLGRCALPYEVKDVICANGLSVYEIAVTYRSNYGPKNQKTSFYLAYDQKDGSCLRIETAPSMNQLPLYVVQRKKQESFWKINGKDYCLVKPNKHYLKRFNSNIFFKKGVMEINLFFISENKPTTKPKHVTLTIYPSVIDECEYLVIEVDGMIGNLGIEEVDLNETRNQAY